MPAKPSSSTFFSVSISISTAPRPGKRLPAAQQQYQAAVDVVEEGGPVGPVAGQVFQEQSGLGDVDDLARVVVVAGDHQRHLAAVQPGVLARGGEGAQALDHTRQVGLLDLAARDHQHHRIVDARAQGDAGRVTQPAVVARDAAPGACRLQPQW